MHFYTLKLQIALFLLALLSLLDITHCDVHFMKLHCIFSPIPIIKWHLVLILSTESVASLLLSPLNILHPHWPVGQWLHGTSMVEWVFLMKPCYVHCCVHSRFAWYPLIWRSGAADYGSPWQNWTTCWERMLWPLISLAIEYILFLLYHWFFLQWPQWSARPWISFLPEQICCPK